MKTGAILLLALTLVAANAHATPGTAPDRTLAGTLSGEAKAEYDLGRVLYQNRDFRAALAKFKRAHDITPDPRLFWNMAACEKNLSHYVKGLQLVESYLSTGGALVTDEDRRQAAEYQARARLLVSKVTLSLKEPGITVFVDDEQVGVTPLTAPLYADIGDRHFRFSKQGFRDKTVTQDVPGGTEVSIAVELERDVHEGRVAINAGPNEDIDLDGKHVAKERWNAAVPSGPHVVTVSAPGKKARRIDLVLGDHDTREFSVSLESERSTWPWIAGGAVLVAGAVVGGYFLFRPHSPDVKQGTLSGYQVP